MGTAGPVVTNTDPTVWVDDQLPDNAAMTAPDQSGNVGQNRFWAWNSTTVYSGVAALDSTVVAGIHRQYFTGANARAVGSNDILFAYVWIDPSNLPQQIMLEWQDSGGSWNHLAYWGENLIGSGLDGSTGLVNMGALAAAGQWVRLAVPASSVGLAGKSVSGFSFDLYNGRALLDKIGNVNNASTLSGTVYQDNNGNGTFERGEIGLAGRTVYLDLNNNGIQNSGEPSTMTNSAGAYSFSNLSEGTYTVRQVLPAGFVASTAAGASYSESVIAGVATTQNLGEFPTNFTAGWDGDSYTIGRSTDGSRLQIWENSAESVTPGYSIANAELSQLTIHTAGFYSTVTADFSNGSPLASGGFTFDGGLGLGNLVILGMRDSPNAFQVSSGAVNVNGVSIGFTNPRWISVVGGSANDVLTQLASPAPLTFIDGGGNDVLNVDGGNYTFAGHPQPATAALTVNVAASASVTFAAGMPGSGFNLFHLAGLNLSGGAVATLACADASSDRSVLILNSLVFAGTSNVPQGQLDLSNNDMIVRGGDIQAVQSELASGYGGGTWVGASGIVSSAAHSDATYLTALGLMPGLAVPFDGQGVSSSDVLVKYTYYGDTNLDGRVDGTDYSRLDNSYMNPATGWFNGDFNYDGVIDGSDYTLLDNAFNAQVASLSASVATVQLASPGVQAIATQMASGGGGFDFSNKKKPRMYIRGLVTLADADLSLASVTRSQAQPAV